MKRVVFFLTVACVLPIVFAFLLYPFLKYAWGHNPRYDIQAIVQKKPAQDALKCAFLAESLNLTSGKVNLYHFDINEGVEKLCATCVIKDASIKKLKPNTLFIDYTLRKPIAYVADRANTAIDEEGMLIPFAPFYTPKHLPEIYFGDRFSHQVWGSHVHEKKLKMVKEILSLFPSHSISWIDVSHIEAASLGQKEIVVEYKSQLLRLSPKNYAKEIAHFFAFKKQLDEDLGDCILDMRIPNVAYLTPLSH